MRSCWLLLVLAGVILLNAGEGTPSAVAQVHELGPTPWSALADSSSRGGVDIDWRRGLGGPTRWRTDRLSLTWRVPVGVQAMAYIRGSYVRLDTGDQWVLQRWPGILSEEPEIDPGTWPGEGMLEDFGQPEVGLLWPMGLPLLGAGRSAFELTLPFGKDETYPLSSRALVMRLNWRREELAVGPLALAGRIGWELSLDASGDVFASEAFPDGLRLGVSLGSPQVAHRGLAFELAARELSGDRERLTADLHAWTEVGAGHRIRAILSREVGDASHRTTDWRLGIGFELRRSSAEDEDQRKMPSPPDQDPPAASIPQSS